MDRGAWQATVQGVIRQRVHRPTRMSPPAPRVSCLILDPKQNPTLHLAVVPPWSLHSGTVPQPCFVFHDLHHFEESCRMNLNFGLMLLHD